MEKKANQKIIFFADHLVEDIFVKSFKKYPRPKTGKKLAENTFYIFTSSESKKFSRFYLDLYEHIIIFRRGKEKRNSDTWTS